MGNNSYSCKYHPGQLDESVIYLFLIFYLKNLKERIILVVKQKNSDCEKKSIHKYFE